jgi:hypothetical protein
MDEKKVEQLNELIVEYREQRVALKEMIKDLEKIKEKVDTLFPESIDKRYVRFFEEKVKSVTGLFSAILGIRKEICNNIKDEMEMLRKIDGNKEDGLGDISELANQVESYQKESYKLLEGGKKE